MFFEVLVINFLLLIVGLFVHINQLRWRTLKIDCSKIRTDADIKEVIRLAVFPMFCLTRYYDPSPPLEKVATNSMSPFYHFCDHQKGCIYIAVRSLMPDITYPKWYIRLPLIHLMQVHWVYLIWSPDPRY